MTEKEDNKKDYFKDDLEEETEQLLREMKSKSKENKLLKIKAMDNLDKLQAEETKTFGNATEKFTRSKRDQNVQDAEVNVVEMNDEFMEKLDQEGEEFSKDELIELQNKLADEQKGLIGKV